MTKKILLGILVCLSCFAMVSCSLDEYAKLGELMGNMGNNVYGIEANMQEVDETTAKVDAAVDCSNVQENEDGSINKESVTVTVDSSVSESIINSVASIKNSPQKTAELQTQLEQPISENSKVAKVVQEKLQDEVAKILGTSTSGGDSSGEGSGDTGATTTVSLASAEKEIENIKDEKVKETVQTACNTVKEALTNIKENIPESPTKADLATVSIVVNLATSVTDIVNKVSEDAASVSEKDLIDAADKAFSALDALKVTTTAANGIDKLLEEFNFTSLLSAFTSNSDSSSSETTQGIKGISKDTDGTEDTGDTEGTEDVKNSDIAKYEELLEKTLKSIVEMVSEDGKFNEAKYNKFMFQLRAIRTAYEMTAVLSTPKIDVSSITPDNPDAQAFAFVDALLNVSYASTKKFSTNDAVLYTIAFVLTEGEDFYSKYGKDETGKNAVKTVMKEYVEYFNDEHSNEELQEMWSQVEKAVSSVDVDNLKKEGVLESYINKAKTALNTDLIIILDAGFNLKGTLETFKVLSELKTSTYADFLYNVLEDLKTELGISNS